MKKERNKGKERQINRNVIKENNKRRLARQGRMLR